MIWLASFPRSGNTFFRNVLYEVYGIKSSTYHQDYKRDLDKNYDRFEVVKTHLLPDQLPDHIKNAKSVYLTRDGRDALVSMAHHRKDIVDIGSDFYNNLLLAIMSPEGSYFGGWSENVKQWTEKADIVIKFEDLIKDPIKELEKLRAIMDLPAPDISKLPTFKQLKFGKPKYGDKSSKPNAKSFAQLNFRKGKSGGWKEEMPKELHRLFWDVHKTQMVKNGYTKSMLADRPNKKVKVLINASKLDISHNDGIKRYLLELLNHLLYFLQYRPNWEVYLHRQSSISPLGTLEDSFIKDRIFISLDKVLLKIKAIIQWVLPLFIYKPLSHIYREYSFRSLLNWFKEVANPQRKNKGVNEETISLDDYNLIHVPLPQNMVEYENVNTNIVVTLHDVTHKLFPEFHTEQNIANAEEGMQLIKDKNTYIIAVSESSRQDVIKHYTIPEDKIKLIYEGAAGKFNKDNRLQNLQPILKSYNLPNLPYFLTLSTLEPRKNIKNTIIAFIELKKKHPKSELALFICGNKGWKYEELLSLSEDELNKKNVYFIGFVDDVDLGTLLAHARALCYISHYEGFGLPMLEAMQSGVPVIFGDNSSMPEVVSRGGVGVNSKDVTAITNAMESIAFDDDFQKELSVYAWEQADTFSWLKTAFETINIYEEIISQREGT